MAGLYRVYSAPHPTTASLAVVATGTNIKTLLQLKLKSGVLGRIKAWGISFDGTTANTPVICELLETGTVFATVTAHAAGDYMQVDKGLDPTTALLDVGTSAGGYNASSEGTITTTDIFDAQLVSPTGQYIYQFPLGQEPIIGNGNSTRIRVKAGTTVNAICWIEFEI